MILNLACLCSNRAEYIFFDAYLQTCNGLSINLLESKDYSQ